MGILELIVVLVTIAGLFAWNRTASRLDYRRMESQINAIRELVYQIHLETKDFHNRLCLIEEKKNNLLPK